MNADNRLISKNQEKAQLESENISKPVDENNVELTQQISLEDNTKAILSQSTLQEQIQANQHSIVQNFSSLIQRGLELKIITIVEDEDDLINSDLTNIEGEPGKRIVTLINLADGDIKNIIGSKFVKNLDYQNLQKFHNLQVEKSQEIIQKNLESLKLLLEYLLTTTHIN